MDGKLMDWRFPGAAKNAVDFSGFISRQAGASFMQRLA